MCGILAILLGGATPAEREAAAAKYAATMKHRGPDEGPTTLGGADWCLAHTRLSIMGLDEGQQPMALEAPLAGSASAADCFTGNRLTLVANGEIFNHRELAAKHGVPTAELRTGSDSEILLHLYRRCGPAFVGELNGMFAFVVVESDAEGRLVSYFAARDHVGVKPLYMGEGADGLVVFSSELKGVAPLCRDEGAVVHEFPAGTCVTRGGGKHMFFKPAWDCDEGAVPALPSTLAHVREGLAAAVRRRMMADVEVGSLLSGGIDSCIVTALICREWTGAAPLKTFTVGMEGSPDILAARAIAAHLGTDHHERLFTAEEAFGILELVVQHVETYEPELIRSCIPNFFLAEIAASKVKVVITGEGADETFAGYRYFHDCPGPQALHTETRRIFEALQRANLLRCDRMTMAHGLEARVPFLDHAFVDVAMRVPARDRLPRRRVGREGDADAPLIEKHFLREAFSDLVPDSVLWRAKAMQCEGVGANWVETLQALCEARVSDAEYKEARARYAGNNPPQSKEEALYRNLFEKHYSGMDAFIHVWEGGCRAGGAAWKSASYTRHGLANTDTLFRGVETLGCAGAGGGSSDSSASSVGSSGVEEVKRTERADSGAV